MFDLKFVDLRRRKYPFDVTVSPDGDHRHHWLITLLLILIFPCLFLITRVWLWKNDDFCLGLSSTDLVERALIFLQWFIVGFGEYSWQQSSSSSTLPPIIQLETRVFNLGLNSILRKESFTQ